MKPFFLSAFIAIIVLSCNETADSNNTNGKDSTDADNSTALYNVSDQIYKGMETGDSALLRQYVSDDAVDHAANMDGSDMKGAAVISMLSSVKKHVPNINVEVLKQASNEDHVFALVHMTGTVETPFWGMPAGHKMDSKSVDIIRIKDGKAVDHWGFLDQAEVMKMMQGGNTNKPATDTTKR
jgi:predicted SnoaL-like aldol condensation-catalyzing enzyme